MTEYWTVRLGDVFVIINILHLLAPCHICTAKRGGQWSNDLPRSHSPYQIWQSCRQKRNATMVQNARPTRGMTIDRWRCISFSRVSSGLCRCSCQTARRPCWTRTADSRRSVRLSTALLRNLARSSRSFVASSRLDLCIRASTAPKHVR